MRVLKDLEVTNQKVLECSEHLDPLHEYQEPLASLYAVHICLISSTAVDGDIVIIVTNKLGVILLYGLNLSALGNQSMHSVVVLVNHLTWLLSVVNLELDRFYGL